MEIIKKIAVVVGFMSYFKTYLGAWSWFKLGTDSGKVRPNSPICGDDISNTGKSEYYLSLFSKKH